MAFSRSTAISLLVAGAFFMENLDGTVIVTAIPQMAKSFAIAPIDLSLGVSSYILAMAVLIPASGWLTDRFGGKTIFASAIIVFTLASILCGISPSLPTFVLARVIQGVGGAMMVPVGRLVVLRSAKKEEIISAIGLIVWPGLAAPVVGPPLGGFITTYFSWHWIFFLNVPLGAIALYFALRLIPQGELEKKPFDWLGFVFTGVSCFAIMLAIQLLSMNAPPVAWIASLLIGGVLIGVAAVWQERREKHPLVDLYALRFKSFALNVWSGTMFRASIGAIPFLLPLVFQIGFGLDPFVSGLLVLSVFAGNIVMKIFTTATLNRFGFRRVLLVNGFLNAAVLLTCALIDPGTPVPLIIGLLFLSGVTRSMQFTTLSTIAYAEVPQDKMNGANTLQNVVQPIGFAFGIAVAALGIRAGTLIFPAAGAAITMPQFHVAFVIVGLLALAAVFETLRLPAGIGDDLRKTPARRTRSPAMQGEPSK